MSEVRFSGLLLQDFIVPLVAYGVKDGKAYLVKSFGTAFFIGTKGTFLTAKHVIEQALSYVSRGNAEGWAISGKFPLGTSDDAIFPIQGYEYAPNGLDVAVGRTTVAPKPSPLSVRLGMRLQRAVWGLWVTGPDAISVGCRSFTG